MIKVIESKKPIFVEKIFCINLEKDVERKEDMMKRLQKFNLDNKVSFFKGIYNKDKPTIGCRTSHFKIIKNAYKNKLNSIMILEDDAEFNEFPFKINDTIPDDWDMIYPGWLDIDLKSFRYSNNLVKLKSGRSTFCYILNYKSYPYILRMIGCNEHIDMFYSNIIQNSMNCYGLYPVKVFQTLNVSNISGEINNNINKVIIENSIKVYNNKKPKKENNQWLSHYLYFQDQFNNNYDLNIIKLCNIYIP